MKLRKNLITVASALLLSQTAFADNTWDGGGTDGNWSTLANWGADTAPNYANALVFAGTNNLTTNNDATASVAAITFNSGADPFTLNGNSVTLGGNITNNSTNLQTINLPLVLSGNRTIATTSGNITLGGTISGAFNLVKTQGNTLTMNTAGSSFSLFQINTGTARLGVNDALPTGAGVTFATATTAILNLNGKTQALGAAITVAGTAGTVTISDTVGGLLKLGGNVVQNVTSSPTVNISAPLDLNGATRNFQLNNPSGVVTVSGPISNSTGTAGIGKTGTTGELILSGVNTFNGNTTVTAGLLTIGNSLALQNSTLATTGSIASTGVTNGLKTTVTNITLGGLSGDKNLTSLFDASNGYGTVTNVTLNPGTGTDITYTGVIADGAAGMTLTKTGAGKQTLNAVNLYTGGTFLSGGGTLNYSNSSALSSGPISYTGGAVLQAGIATTLANAINVNFAGVGSIGTNGFDTTLSGPITGNGSLAKTGGGILTLTGAEANTIAGGFRVGSNGGRLVVADGKSLTNTGPVTVLSGGSLDYSKNITGNDLTNAITLSGPGDGTLGALNLRGNANATGTITLDADATISHDFNAATISNSITGTDRNLTLTTLTTGTPQPGMTVSGPINLGAGGITVTGVANSGGFSIKLTGDNSYSGGTVVTSGILLVSNTTGSGTGSGTVSVNSGAAIGGSGTIAGTLNVPSGATLVPGNFNIGTLTVGGNSVIAGTYRCGIDGTSKDMLAVTGDLNVSGGTLEVVELGLGADQASYIIASYTGTLTGTLSLSAPVTGYNLVHDTNNKQIRLDAVGGGNNYASWAIANSIPGEPFDDDFNNDGISNGVAYALGLSPTGSSQSAGVLTGTTITFNKGTEAITNADVSWIIEVSESLLAGSWTDQVTQAAGNPAGVISYDLAPAPGTPKKFARLKVVRTP